MSGGRTPNQRPAGRTPTRTVGGHNTVTKDTEVPSQVISGHTPAAATPADRQARKDF
jgi:hypothetical protein